MDSYILIGFSAFTAAIVFIAKFFRMQKDIAEKKRIIDYQEKMLNAQETAKKNRENVLEGEIPSEDILKKYGNLRDE